MFLTKVRPEYPPPGSPLRIRDRNSSEGSASGSAHVDLDELVKAQKARIVSMLLKGKIYGLPGSEGTRWSNFREWAKNQHPVLSMFMAHELHPFSKTERFSVMMCYLCWAFFITVVFEKANHDSEATCTSGCENAFNFRQEEMQVCGPGSGDNEDKVTVGEYNSACDKVMEWYILSFIIAACTVPYSTILKGLATCACAQSMPSCVKSCVEAMGSVVLRLFGVLSVIWLAVGISISLELDGGLFLATYTMGVMKSWLYWPLLAGAVFAWKYKKQRQTFETDFPAQIAMAWPLTVQDTRIEVKVGRDGQPVAFKSPPGSPKLHQPPEDNGDGTTPQLSPYPIPVEIVTRGQLRDTTFASTTVPLNHLTQPEVAQCASPLQFGAQPDRDWRLVSPPSHGMPMNQGYYGAAQGMTANGPTCRGISSELEPTVTDFGRMGEGRGDDEKQMRHGTAMPCGWEMRIEPNGRALYINHNARTTQWDPPATTPYQAQLLQSQCVHEDRNSPGHPPQHVDPYVAYAVDFQHQPLSAEGCTDRHPSPSRFGHSQIADPHLHATYEGQRPTYANPERHEAHNAQQVMSRDQAHESPSFHQAQLPGGHGAPLQYNMIGAEYSRQHQQSQQHMQGGVSSQQGTAPAHVPRAELPAQAAAPTTMEFQVPGGVTSGGVVEIHSPTGVAMRVTIPEGFSAGDRVQVPIPS